MLQKTLKITETLANGYSYESTQRELSNEYQHDSVWTVFKEFRILVSWTKVASVIKGLTKRSVLSEAPCESTCHGQMVYLIETFDESKHIW